MKKLFIIGNGFDRFNGLKTSYSDFHSFVTENYEDLEDDIENYFSFKLDENSLWRDFENDLATFNFKNLFDSYNNIDVLSETFKPSEAFGLEDEIIEVTENLVDSIKEAFRSWIEEIDILESHNNQASKLNFGENSLFVNFNYTGTLELLYHVPKSNILYIHNNTMDMHGDLIFGHDVSEEGNPEQDELDNNGDSNRTMFTDAEAASRSPFYAFIKNTAEVLELNKVFLNSLKDIDCIIVLGHSLGRVDWPYFQKLGSLFPSANWKISYYGENEREKLKFTAEEMLAEKAAEIEMITIDELMFKV